MYVNRGNHEAKDMNSSYGFEGEVKHKHGDQTYKVRADNFLFCVLFLICDGSSLPMFSQRVRSSHLCSKPCSPDPFS